MKTTTTTPILPFDLGITKVRAVAIPLKKWDRYDRSRALREGRTPPPRAKRVIVSVRGLVAKKEGASYGREYAEGTWGSFYLGAARDSWGAYATWDRLIWSLASPAERTRMADAEVAEDLKPVEDALADLLGKLAGRKDYLGHASTCAVASPELAAKVRALAADLETITGRPVAPVMTDE